MRVCVGGGGGRAHTHTQPAHTKKPLPFVNARLQDTWCAHPPPCTNECPSTLNTECNALHCGLPSQGHRQREDTQPAPVLLHLSHLLWAAGMTAGSLASCIFRYCTRRLRLEWLG